MQARQASLHSSTHFPARTCLQHAPRVRRQHAPVLPAHGRPHEQPVAGPKDDISEKEQKVAQVGSAAAVGEVPRGRTRGWGSDRQAQQQQVRNERHAASVSTAAQQKTAHQQWWSRPMTQQPQVEQWCASCGL